VDDHDDQSTEGETDGEEEKRSIEVVTIMSCRSPMMLGDKKEEEGWMFTSCS